MHPGDAKGYCIHACRRGPGRILAGPMSSLFYLATSAHVREPSWQYTILGSSGDHPWQMRKSAKKKCQYLRILDCCAAGVQTSHGWPSELATPTFNMFRHLAPRDRTLASMTCFGRSARERPRHLGALEVAGGVFMDSPLGFIACHLYSSIQ
eukprot:7689713-Lingulodinium_polyedra.AAC.1